VRDATEAVRTRLLSRAPPYLFEEIRAAILAASAGVDREMSKPRDFAGAKRFVARLKNEGSLNEATLLDLATERRYEDCIVALAELSDAGVEIVRPLMQSLRSDGILVPCRVADLAWETVHAVLDCRFSVGVTAADEIEKLQSQYKKLTLDEAHRLLRLWTVRRTSASSSLH
jgi:Uncharacterised protein conserved in bacteria (DUF2336)